MSSVPKLQAVIFDYGAVLCHLPTAEQLDEFSSVARLPRDEFWTLYLGTRAPYDRGSLDARGYWSYFGERAGRKYSDTEIARLSELDISVWLSMNDSMLELAREVRNAGLTTAILSNMPADLMHVIRREADWLGLFDKHFFSCEIGAVKPNLGFTSTSWTRFRSRRKARCWSTTIPTTSSQRRHSGCARCTLSRSIGSCQSLRQN